MVLGIRRLIATAVVHAGRASAGYGRTDRNRDSKRNAVLLRHTVAIMMGMSPLVEPAVADLGKPMEEAELIYAAGGAAHRLVFDSKEPSLRPLTTAEPVYKIFGRNTARNLLLYRPLENGTPSVRLVVEDTRRHISRSFDSYAFLQAAWSTVDPELIAFTCSLGDRDGIGILDLSTNQARLLRKGDFLTDRVAWAPDGRKILIYSVIDRVRVAAPGAQADDTTPLFRLDFVDAKDGGIREAEGSDFPPGFPLLHGPHRPGMRVSESTVLYAFGTAAPDGRHYVDGRDFISEGAISMRTRGRERAISVGKGGLLEQVLSHGIVLRRFDATGSSIEFHRWNGTSLVLGRTTTSETFHLPILTSVVTQGGASYAAPGRSPAW